MRKIVVLRPHEWLSDSFHQQNFSIAAGMLERDIQTRGMRFLEEAPVQFPVADGVTPTLDTRGRYSFIADHDYALPVEFADDEAEARFIRDRSNEVKGVFSDPVIQPFPIACPSAAVGSVTDVGNQIRLASLHAAGHRGIGVRIAVIDTGIDGSQINVAGGLNRTGFPAPGTSSTDHGTMVAFDARIAAPDASIYDYPLLKSSGGMWVGFLSDAIRIYAELLTLILNFPGPLVANNSWGMYDRSQDQPAGNSQN